ncbi:hypothetical protein PsYK624_169720 [Phanerochaete sordida]|uniref:Uncharacterized protein n=1 Tax=Phanerochaete sordida TaxID=48140 RepID=A0A9P3LNV5_9APHY|nr:hypothetical protein PsYK624_169720 [Phanerochaete sordida]
MSFGFLGRLTASTFAGHQAIFDAMDLDRGKSLDEICGFKGPSSEELERRALLEAVMALDQEQTAELEAEESKCKRDKHRARSTSKRGRHLNGRRYKRKKLRAKEAAKAATLKETGADGARRLM